jgi:serine protease DegQ
LEVESYIQHDASINPGNSGGALINFSGELIGINTTIVSPAGGSVGLGFAIPSKLALRVGEEIVKYGKVKRGRIGVLTEDMTPELAQTMKVSVVQGALVKIVQKGSPADTAGLKVGDVITAINGIPIRKATDFRAKQAVAEIGEKGTLDYVRDGKTTRVTIATAELKSDPVKVVVPPSIKRLDGVTLTTIQTDETLFGEVAGAEVVEVKTESLAYVMGLLPGDIITAIDQDKVRIPEDVPALTASRDRQFDIHAVRKGAPVLIRIPF